MNYTITESQLDELNKKIDGLKDLIKSTISPEFKEGDYVYIESGGSGAHGCDGEYGQITDDDYTNGYLNENHPKVKLLNGLKVWALNPESMSIRKVDEKEIEDHVLQKAERRGLVLGCKAKCLGGDTIEISEIYFFNGRDKDIMYRFNLTGHRSIGGVIFSPEKGWATPIKEKVLTIGEAEKLLNERDENLTYSIRH